MGIVNTVLNNNKKIEIIFNYNSTEDISDYIFLCIVMIYAKENTIKSSIPNDT